MSSTTNSDLSNDAIDEVITHIPIKQLMRMKSLSKRWNHIISSHRNTKSRTSKSTFLCQYHTQGISDQNQVILLNTSEFEGEKLSKSILFSQDKNVNFAGSRNGLIVYSQFVDPDKLIVHVCNSRSKEWCWERLPTLVHGCNRNHNLYFNIGIAYDGRDDNDYSYKVVCYSRFRGGKLEYDVYSSDERKWRHGERGLTEFGIPSNCGYYCPIDFVLVIESPQLYWKGMMLSILKDKMLAYHFETDAFMLLNLPKEDVYCWDGFLFESEECLHYCYGYKDGFRVWKYGKDNLFEDQSNNEDWKLKHTRSMEGFPTMFQPCAFDDDLQILYIQLPTSIISYSLETRRFKTEWSFEQLTVDRSLRRRRSCSIQSNGATFPVGGDFKF
ncbi:hypothetical protein ACHQM5_013551 [Ranunculus cassubicifolius]